jgi:mono/diheme cytochrome c family protein
MLATITAACSAAADEATNVTADQILRGEAIAKGRCAICHAVGADDKSPTWVNRNTAFRRLAERFPIPMLQQAAQTGIISGHDEMPEFSFTLDEITALLAYIDSLAPPASRYLNARQ